MACGNRTLLRVERKQHYELPKTVQQPVRKTRFLRPFQRVAAPGDPERAPGPGSLPKRRFFGREMGSEKPEILTNMAASQTGAPAKPRPWRGPPPRPLPGTRIFSWPAAKKKWAAGKSMVQEAIFGGDPFFRPRSQNLYRRGFFARAHGVSSFST